MKSGHDNGNRYSLPRLPIIVPGACSMPNGCIGWPATPTPHDARAFHLVGVVAHQLGRNDAAALIGRAVTLNPDFAEAHNDRGVILAANGSFAEALPCFERAVQINPAYAEARSNLGRALRAVGRAGEAATQFEQVLKGAPNSPFAHFNLASALELAGQPDAARKALPKRNRAAG